MTPLAAARRRVRDALDATELEYRIAGTRHEGSGSWLRVEVRAND